jgi:hypothetical protein
MHKTLQIVLAAATVLSAGIPVDRAAAAMLTAPLGDTATDSVRQATVVCGSGGCAPVQTKAIKHKNKLPQHI